MPSEILLLVPIFQILLIIALAFTLFWALWRVFRWLLRLFWISGTGESGLSRLVALAVVLPFFPEFVWYLQRTLPRIVETAFVGIPGTFIESWRELDQKCQQAQIEECLVALPEPLFSNWIYFFRRILDDLGIQDFPIIDTISLFAVWLLLAIVVNWLKTSGATGIFSISARAYGNLAQIPVAVRNNVVFLGLLLVAGYLSLTSITAIPILASEESDDSSLRDTLTSELTHASSQVDKFLKDFENQGPGTTQSLGVISTDKIANLFASTQQLSQSEVANKQIGTPQIQYQLSQRRIEESLHDLEKSVAASHENLSRNWNILLSDYKAREDQMRHTAELTFKINDTARKGAREKAQHLIDISRWYQSVLYEREKQIKTCLGAIRKFESDVELGYGDLVRLINRRSQQASFEPSGMIIQIIDTDETLGSSARTATDECDPTLIPDWRIPDRLETGSFLGPFGAAAGYILRTESLELALISGLLGFGLLGATASTFIKEREERTAQDPWVKDLIGVVVRGTSAAIVMFLAVYGGLAVFAGSEADPNPYVVLFACLVAGVFSENVWAWARQTLENLLKGKSRDGGEQGVG